MYMALKNNLKVENNIGTYYNLQKFVGILQYLLMKKCI